MRLAVCGRTPLKVKTADVFQSLGQPTITYVRSNVGNRWLAERLEHVCRFHFQRSSPTNCKAHQTLGGPNDPRFPGFPVCLVRSSITSRHAARKFDRCRPTDSQNGETLGLPGLELAALPSSRRTSALVVHRISVDFPVMLVRVVPAAGP